MPAELKFFSGANEEPEGGRGHWTSARPQKGWHPHPARLDRQQPSTPPPPKAVAPASLLPQPSERLTGPDGA